MAEKKNVRQGHEEKKGHSHEKKEHKHEHAPPKKEHKEHKEKKDEKREEKKGKKTIEEIEAEIKSLGVIKYPLITEKAVNMIEAENKLVFVVDSKATKSIVKESVESLYKVKVSSVNILKDMKARKRAVVTIDKKFKADDIATKLGVI